MANQNGNYVETVVIGGGQAGLSVGYHLAKRGMRFVSLDANQRVGDAWRNRWDSLRLFTPARYSGLPGLPFPAGGSAFPTKGQMAGYLEHYARRFQLPVKNNVRVERLSKKDGRFLVAANNYEVEADNVVVAMGNYQQPKWPAFAKDLDYSIVQLHAHDYRNPAQLQDGPVLIVGVGNSGADIAMEIVKTHRTWISGKESGHIPWRIESFMARNFFVRMIRFIGHHVLTVKTPIGRKARPKLLERAAPLIRIKPGDLVKSGMTRVPRVTGARDGLPLLENGGTLEVRNVIWCTGYTAGFDWIDLPIFDERKRPVHDCGVAAREPGLYFVGLRYLYSMTSDTITGVARDAERIVKALATRTKISKAA